MERCFINFNHNDAEYLSRRKHDRVVEKNVSNILDALYKENDFDVIRNSDIELQKKGVDIIATIDGKEKYIDEKSASTYFQKHLHTFAFEIATANNKNGNGWFDPDNDYIITDYYMLAYPYAPDRPKSDDLETVDEIEALLIKKSAIWDYLRSCGIDSVEKATKLLKEKGILTDRNNMRVNPEYTPFKNVYIHSKDIKIVHSLYLKESPINIVISRKVLTSLAEKVFFKQY